MLTNLLFEIGCEELPANGQQALSLQLLTNIEALLSKQRLSFNAALSVCYASPRRLAIFIADCQLTQAPLSLLRKGPSLLQAFAADGSPTKAALGFAKSCNVAIGELHTQHYDDGDYLAFNQTSIAKTTLELLPELLNQALNQLSIARPMRWGQQPVGFVRPIKWLLALFGDDIIPVNCFGITADRLSFGHRFMAPNAIALASADQENYETCLKKAFVIPHFQTRQRLIAEQIKQQAALQKSQVVAAPVLLTEVTGLVEWPVALTIAFDPRFLTLPSEALIASMQNHQKCFALQDSHGQLQPYFITISNIASLTPTNVITGNARVMHARLSDAEFFYQQDLKIPLSDYSATLDKMTYQHSLGSMQAKVAALTRLTVWLAPLLKADPIAAAQAASLAKSDLCTQMVGEFPELQGIMGRTYALHQGLSEPVANALDEYYLPRFASDTLPTSPIAASLALADRLLTLTGIFGIGQIPSGDKDPFALRRAALGVIRILLVQDQHLSLSALLKASVTSWQFSFKDEHTATKVYDFIIERLRYYWLEQPAFSATPKDTLLKAIDAVVAKKSDDLSDSQARLIAILAFQALPEAESLASANKRVNNLLRKENFENAVIIQEALLLKPAEQQLFNQLTHCQSALQALLTESNYPAALQQLATLKAPVDAFFNDVMVLDTDQALRVNRLALLQQLQQLLQTVADLSCL